MAISIIRTVIIYALIVFAVRIMGKRQISELQTTELVVTLLISDLAVIPMQNIGQPLSSGVIPIFILVGIEILMSVLMLKNSKIRKIVCGKPVVIINDGKILQSEMKELRMSTEDLFEELRQKDVFSLKEIKYGIIETNGTLSIMKNEPYETVKNKDLEINSQAEFLNLVVVSDGEICSHSLKFCGKDESFINDTLQKENIKLEEIYIMTSDKTGDYTVIKKE